MTAGASFGDSPTNLDGSQCAPPQLFVAQPASQGESTGEGTEIVRRDRIRHKFTEGEATSGKVVLNNNFGAQPLEVEVRGRKVTGFNELGAVVATTVAAITEVSIEVDVGAGKVSLGEDVLFTLTY